MFASLSATLHCGLHELRRILNLENLDGKEYLFSHGIFWRAANRIFFLPFCLIITGNHNVKLEISCIRCSNKSV